MRVESLELPSLDSDYRSTGSVRDLLWVNDRQKLWLGWDGDSSAVLSPDLEQSGYLAEWDISAALPVPTAGIQVHGRVLNIHQMSTNVILAEVDDPDMQFFLHDWRTPRAAQRFGYDNSSGVGTYLRGSYHRQIFAFVLF